MIMIMYQTRRYLKSWFLIDSSINKTSSLIVRIMNKFGSETLKIESIYFFVIKFITTGKS